jgi:SAM-dependent methyltransferase
MPSSDAPSYQQRERAESFGLVAADYDRYRPSYPAPLIDDLVALQPGAVLDIGCGTGKASRLLSARGLSVLGVEVDPQMAEVARSHGTDVEVGTFEQWDDRGRTFDLIISAQAWHWVDPAIGGPKAARLLNADGTMVLFWNHDDIDPTSQTAVDAVYGDLAPELASIVAKGASSREDRPYVADLEATGSFRSIKVRRYKWQAVLPADEWVGRVGTQSAHVALGPQRRAALLAALRTALADAGGEVHLDGGTYAVWAQC